MVTRRPTCAFAITLAAIVITSPGTAVAVVSTVWRTSREPAPGRRPAISALRRAPAQPPCAASALKARVAAMVGSTMPAPIVAGLAGKTEVVSCHLDVGLVGHRRAPLEKSDGVRPGDVTDARGIVGRSLENHFGDRLRLGLPTCSPLAKRRHDFGDGVRVRPAVALERERRRAGGEVGGD